jgi:hydroxyacylglutathione hydrolase
VVPFDHPVVFVVPSEAGEAATECARDLALIGIDGVAGFVGPETLARLVPLAVLERVAAADAMARQAQGTAIIDVRNSSERAAYRVPGTRHIPFPQLIERARELPRDQPLLIQCETGARSVIAASVLRAPGFDAADAGGIIAWSNSGGAMENGAT